MAHLPGRTTPVGHHRNSLSGYDEICWGRFDKLPSEVASTLVYPNDEFQDWVTDTFSVEIPATAAEIVKHPAELGDEDSPDLFWQWVKRNTA
jgi:hypothetical protein